jgi:hypothetical protein
MLWNNNNNMLIKLRAFATKWLLEEDWLYLFDYQGWYLVYYHVQEYKTNWSQIEMINRIQGHQNKTFKTMVHWNTLHNKK